MLLDRKNFFKLHVRWFIATVVIAALCIAWYAAEAATSDRLPGGSSRSGLFFGVLAALICFFEAALIIRKTSWFRTRRWLLSAQTWMKAHIWLGLLAVPLVAMHAGFSFGGTLAWLLAWSFILVIVSGVVGLILQNTLPRLLIAAVPSETIYSQIDEMGRQFADDAARLAGLYDGDVESALPQPREEHAPAMAGVEPTSRKPVVGAPRRVGTVVLRSRQPEEDLARGADSPEVRSAVRGEVLDFLRTGKSATGRLGSAQRLGWFFDDLRRRAAPEARPAVDAVEKLCQRRLQLNLQQKIHFVLHSWLWLHLPLSAALIGLLVIHIVFALRYN